MHYGQQVIQRGTRSSSTRVRRLVVLIQPDAPLLSAEYHAFAFDQRGHGTQISPNALHGGLYAADVNAFMDAVGIEKATLVGDSSGGMIAQRVALDYPHRVSRSS